MRKIICLFLFFSFFFLCTLNVNSKEVTNDYKDKKILEDLAFSEYQLYKKIYANDNSEERVERLELSLYGAIQDGEIKTRIKKLKKSVTNVSSGGYGLQYSTLPLSKTNILFGNAGFSNSNFHPDFYPKSYNNYNKWNFPKMSPCQPHHSSHRLPPPPPLNNNPNKIINGNYLNDYSLGTSIKILDD